MKILVTYQERLPMSIINIKTTITTLIDYDLPITQSLLLMDIQKNSTVKYSTFERFLKDQIDLIKIKVKNPAEARSSIDTLKKAYNITNLKNNNLIIADDGDASLTFVSFIYEMFSVFLDDMKAKPITDRTFVNHLKNLDGLIEDSEKYLSYNTMEKDRYMEDVQTFLRRVKQDFDKNRKVITTRVANLSKFFDDDADESINKNKIMEEIFILYEKYIEPFYSFLENYNENGFIIRLRDFRQFFKNNNLLEEDEINRFILSYSSYKNDIQEVYYKINDYRRKGKKDLLVYNAIESEYNILDGAISLLQDGKKTRNHLESSDYDTRFRQFNNLKVNNFTRSDVSLDYKLLSERFSKIEDEFLIDFEDNEVTEEELPVTKEEIITRIEEHEIKREIAQFNINLELKITNIIHKNLKVIAKNDSIDLLKKINHILSVNFQHDHKISYTIYAYFLVREKIKNIRVNFEQKDSITIDKRSYLYRPVFVKGAA
jgi:hypothetical protein